MIIIGVQKYNFLHNWQILCYIFLSFSFKGSMVIGQRSTVSSQGSTVKGQWSMVKGQGSNRQIVKGNKQDLVGGGMKRWSRFDLLNKFCHCRSAVCRFPHLI